MFKIIAAVLMLSVAPVAVPCALPSNVMMEIADYCAELADKKAAEKCGANESCKRNYSLALMVQCVKTVKADQCSKQ